MPTDFQLHPQLCADCHGLGDLPLCRALLMNDSQYPWTILVPRRAGVREIYQLDGADQQQLWRESATLSRAMMELFEGEKLNVAALGNVVSQLHVHHVVRHAGDPAWPAPVWGKVPARPYMPMALQQRAARIRQRLQKDFAAEFQSPA